MTDMDATQHVIFVADIDARDELTPKIGDLVYVIDASDDSTVTEGWAKYLWEGTEWLKTAEGESLDVSLNWADILGKPSSTVSQIDAAVANSHTHTNKTDLDKFSEADSVLQYDGVPVQLGPLVVVSADEPTDQPESGIWLRPIETIIED
ncbi:MAG: hypothetical protein LBB94_10060 [Clostridiales bacterium]|nr:hypothetical protein [Clostridiales bacterium]